ncbi:uncharacterized protein BDFB_009096 [Asbolus verrucosus]|uniref:Uncharacterized protein n=1 Tax=Asbolus verrucosus TaxID=1661398 RepID=A0A482W8Q7_ASBVE|nr:uncharacterized protein BDFB_009096 [Asbolus verrucosus]
MKAFDNIALNDNKYQIQIEQYQVRSPKKSERSIDQNSSSSEDEYLAYREGKLPTKSPQIAIWNYLPKKDVKFLLELDKRDATRSFIEDKLQKRPKGIPRIIFRELMYTVIKFCRASKFTVEQTGAVLSQFYLTHLFFTSCLNVGAEKVYEYFKELQLCHSLPFPPGSIKLFNLEEIKNVMIFFCRLYLRNLPIIRFMTLPNFILRVDYPLEPDIVLGKKKKDKKKRKGKGKKKKK